MLILIPVFQYDHVIILSFATGSKFTNYIDFHPTDIISMIISMVYGVYPILYNIRWFKKDATQITNAYPMVIKILSVEIPLLAILAFYYYVINFTEAYNYTVTDNPLIGYLEDYFADFTFFISYSVIGGLIWIAVSNINKL